MIEKQAVIRLKTGLHARPASLFVQEANPRVATKATNNNTFFIFLIILNDQ